MAYILAQAHGSGCGRRRVVGRPLTRFRLEKVGYWSWRSGAAIWAAYSKFIWRSLVRLVHAYLWGDVLANGGDFIYLITNGSLNLHTV